MSSFVSSLDELCFAQVQVSAQLLHYCMHVPTFDALHCVRDASATIACMKGCVMSVHRSILGKLYVDVFAPVV